MEIVNKDNEQNIIIYNTPDGKASVALYAKDGQIWMNQNQLAELFDTSVPNISMHISNILNDKELGKNSVVKDYLTTASDGKDYNVTFYSLDMILALGFRVRSKRGTQFRTNSTFQSISIPSIFALPIPWPFPKQYTNNVRSNSARSWLS